jgi:hypothetical protein
VGLTSHDLMRVAATQRMVNEVETARMAGHLKDFNHRYKTLRLQAQSEGRRCMSYSQAVRKSSGALATKAAASSGAVAKTSKADLFNAVFGEG